MAPPPSSTLAVGPATIEVTRSDLLVQEVDAIVNPANEALAHGGGLAAIVARAAGPELVAQSDAHPEVPTGEAVVTAAGRLPQLAVVHAVGPIWHGGSRGEAGLLARAHESVLEHATDRGYRSVAFPAVSCGVYGYPAEEAAPVALRAVAAFLEGGESGIRLVRFCLASHEHERAFADALDELAAEW